MYMPVVLFVEALSWLEFPTWRLRLTLRTLGFSWESTQKIQSSFMEVLLPVQQISPGPWVRTLNLHVPVVFSRNNLEHIQLLRLCDMNLGEMLNLENFEGTLELVGPKIDYVNLPWRSLIRLIDPNVDEFIGFTKSHFYRLWGPNRVELVFTQGSAMDLITLALWVRKMRETGREMLEYKEILQHFFPSIHIWMITTMVPCKWLFEIFKNHRDVSRFFTLWHRNPQLLHESRLDTPSRVWPRDGDVAGELLRDESEGGQLRGCPDPPCGQVQPSD